MRRHLHAAFLAAIIVRACSIGYTFGFGLRPNWTAPTPLLPGFALAVKPLF